MYDPDALAPDWTSLRAPSLVYSASWDVYHRQRQAHYVSSILTFALITGAVVNFGIGRFPCTLFGYVNISRLGLSPLFTYYTVEGKEKKQLKSMSAAHAVIALLDIAFTIYFIVWDNYTDHLHPYYEGIVAQAIQPPTWMLDDFYRELSVPFWYRQLCVLLGLPTLIQGLLGLFLAYVLYTLKKDMDFLTHAIDRGKKAGGVEGLEPSALGGPPPGGSPPMIRGRPAWPAETEAHGVFPTENLGYYQASMPGDALTRPRYFFPRHSPSSLAQRFDQDPQGLRKRSSPTLPSYSFADMWTRFREEAAPDSSLYQPSPPPQPHRLAGHNSFVREQRPMPISFVDLYAPRMYDPESMNDMPGDMYVSDLDEDRQLQHSRSKLDVVVHKT